ncbi:cell division protein DivIC [Streptohalobacillus salinus]|uniref:Cell division protein DivIC n=1 Tax=Streptohalobacillus salinus TaxID=621096 RepID=A0A2V3W604_9BACI|nr:septum formation initiator family protein [Streptohalobacillus salinus]PXW88461.1 cell division protein DivIC [Streptohalobacillus salinus]
MDTRTDKVKRINSRYMNKYDAHMERQQKRKRLLRGRLMVFMVISFITVVFFAMQYLEKRELYAQKQTEYEVLQEEMNTLETEETALKEEIQLLQDEDYVLRIAKTNYFFTKEGEIVFKLTEETPSY